MLRLRFLLMIVGLIVPSACAPQPMQTQATEIPSATVDATPLSSVDLYRGDAARTGVYPKPPIETLQGVKWQLTFEEDAYFPSFAAGLLFIGTSSGQLLALDPQTGTEMWAFQAQSGPILAVAADADNVYFGAGDDRFYAVNLMDSNRAWSFKTDGAIWSSSPLLMDTMVYFGSDHGQVYALDMKTHQVIWEATVESGVLWQLTGDEKHVYVETQRYLYALDRQTGTEAWKVATPDKWNPAAVMDGVVYAGNGDRQFVAIDAATGKQMWAFEPPLGQWSEWSAPVVTEDRVFVGASNKFMYALDRATGQEVWKFETADWATTDPILLEDVLYFGVGAHANLAEADAQRPFYALDASTGAVLWTFDGDGLVYAAATVGADAIYFKTLNNTLYALH